MSTSIIRRGSKVTLVLIAGLVMFLALSACGSNTKNVDPQIQLQTAISKKYPDLKVVSYDKETKTEKLKKRTGSSKKEREKRSKQKKYVLYTVQAKNKDGVAHTCHVDLKKNRVSCALTK